MLIYYICRNDNDLSTILHAASSNHSRSVSNRARIDVESNSNRNCDISLESLTPHK